MKTERVRVIGLDFATDEEKRGLATGVFEDGQMTVRDARVCSEARTAQAKIADFLKQDEGTALLAIDAPLGWPLNMSMLLPSHHAGDLIGCNSDEFVSRVTDRWITTRVGKKPLNIGADLIAWTALEALRFLSLVEARLVWGPHWDCALGAIEVYPAATLKSWKIRFQKYKKHDHTPARREIVAALRAQMDLGADTTLLETNADALDAVVCLLAARDFLNGQAPGPEQKATAEKEGWIWCRLPEERSEGTDN
jgi:hypothetical protein